MGVEGAIAGVIGEGLEYLQVEEVQVIAVNAQAPRVVNLHNTFVKL